MSITEAYQLRCDSCLNATLIYDARIYLPQDALAYASIVQGWTIYGEKTHCVFCPPLCHLCGTELGDPNWCPTCSLSERAGDGQS